MRHGSVIVSSTRAAAGIYDDQTGPVIVEWMLAHGFQAGPPVVVADGDPVGAALEAALASGAALIVTTGGTGLAPDDRTPEHTAALLTTTLPGFGEELRRRGGSARAVLSRGVAGVAGSTFIVNLPGSTGGVRDGLELLGELVDHVLDQIAGGDHA